MKELIDKVKKDELWLLIGTILLFCFVLLAWLCGAWLDLEIASQLFAAIAGAIIAAIITMLLLKGQSESEETKDKNIKIYEKKVEVYSKFISLMWHTLDDEQVTPEELRDVRSSVFNQLVFLMNVEKIKEITIEIEKLFETDEFEGKRGQDKYITTFANITSILQKDINEIKEEQKSIANDVKNLWNKFAIPPQEDVDKVIVDTNQTEINNIPQGRISTNRTLFFSIWKWENQINLFKKGEYELGLCEYGETWRTNMVKRVQKDDLVFLFQKDGVGFVGIFKVIGWRVFSRKDEEIREHVFRKDREDGHVETVDNEKVKIDVELYDIYSAISDGATSAANIIVEPLIFNYKGIGNPASVYRKTISSYDPGYAWLVCSRFLAIKDDDCTGKLEENTSPDDKKVYNTKLFEEICRKNNVVAASDTENWYNGSSK